MSNSFNSMQSGVHESEEWLRPVVSIITVTYNAELYLRQCIESVTCQTYPQIEYIIIDGGSSDSTINVIREYEDNITYWISEPDLGIYDAMNKGVKRATGDIIYFLNSDDYLASSEVIEKIADYFMKNQDTEILYGNIIVLDEAHGLKYRNGRKITYREIKRGAMICHQSLFFKTKSLIECGSFDTRYRLCADYALLARAFTKNCKTKYIDYDIAHFRMSGASSAYQGALIMLKEMEGIVKANFPGMPYLRFRVVVAIKLFRIYISKILNYFGVLGYWRKLKVKLGIA